MKNLNRSTLSDGLTFLLVFVCNYIWFERLWPTSRLFVFQVRDIERATDFSTGLPIFYGPETTGGGNLFGGFYYFLLSIPIKLGFGWMGTWYLLATLTALTAAFIWFFLSRFDDKSGWFATAIFSFSYPIISNYSHFFNSSFIFLFVVLAYVGIFLSFSSRYRHRARAWSLTNLIIALGIQVHFSIIILLVAALFIQMTAPTLGLGRIEKKPFLKGLVVFLIPLSPFFIWKGLLAFGIQIGVPPPATSGSILFALPSLMYMIKPFLQHQVDNYWAHVFFIFLYFIPLPIISLCLAHVPSGLKIENKEIDLLSSWEVSLAETQKILSICILFSLPILLYVYFNPIGTRYISPLFIGTLFFFALYFAQPSFKFQIHKYNFLLILLLLISFVFLFFNKGFPISSHNQITCFFGFLLLLPYVFSRVLKKQKIFDVYFFSFIATGALIFTQNFSMAALPSFKFNFLSISQTNKISRVIYNNTGWFFEEARRKIFFVNTMKEMDLRLIYQNYSENNKPDMIPDKMPDGFFVATDKDSFIKNNNNLFNVKSWLLDQSIPEDLKVGLRENWILLEKNLPSDDPRLLIVPYFVMDKMQFSLHFQNVGYPYQKIPEDKVFANLKNFPGTVKLAEKSFLFYWNECPGHESFCTTGVFVDIDDSNPKMPELKVNIRGATLSVASEWLISGWTQAWVRPFVKVTCGDKTESRQIMESIGFNNKYSVYIEGFNFINNSILAPFERSIVVKCQTSISEISVGRELTVIDDGRGGHELPRQELVHKL